MWPLLLGGAALVALALSDKDKKRKYITAHQREHLRKRDGETCGICRKRIYNFHPVHIDHKNPLAKGGTNHTRNLQRAHAACNLKKGVKRARRRSA